MKKPELARWAPPGFDLRFELQFFLTGLAAAALYSALYLVRLTAALDCLFAFNDKNARILLPDAEMPPFAGLLGDSLSWFAILMLAAAAFAIWHYAYHRIGSRSIYLMRRLPDRLELHRRCLTLPALELAACAVCAILLFWLYYGLYVLLVPEEVYISGQLALLWR